MARAELLHYNEGNPYYVDDEDSRYALLEELIMNKLVEEKTPVEDLGSLVYLSREDVRRVIEEDNFLQSMEDNTTPGEPGDDDFEFTDYS